MTQDAAAEFIRAMHAETRRGTISAATDSHLTREYRTQGGPRMREPFPAAVAREIGRLRLEAETLQRLHGLILAAPPEAAGPDGAEG
jgi:hypothetical protein